jgi:hypothetical protein
VDGIVELDTSGLSVQGPYDPTTEWHGFFVPSARFSVAVVDATANSSSPEFPSGSSCRDARVVLTGGFFANDADGLRPDGLHVQGSQVLAEDARNWTSGGYIFSLSNGQVGFSPVSEGAPVGALFAVQSKPFLIEDGKVAVGPIQDPMWDRIAIGDASYRGQDGLFVIAAISDLSKRQAMQQHVFANAIASISKAFGLETTVVLNLDGAEGPFIKIPSAGRYYGSNRDRYVPSVICLH